MRLVHHRHRQAKAIGHAMNQSGKAANLSRLATH
jgi:hypothetical protein